MRDIRVEKWNLLKDALRCSLKAGPQKLKCEITGPSYWNMKPKEEDLV
jgi:hypothetical protein